VAPLPAGARAAAGAAVADPAAGAARAAGTGGTTGGVGVAGALTPTSLAVDHDLPGRRRTTSVTFATKGRPGSA